MPKPKSCEDNQRSDDGGHDIAHRFCNLIKVGEDPKRAEQEAANKSSDKAHTQVSKKTKPAAFPCDDQAGEAAPKQSDNDPNDELIDRRQHNFQPSTTAFVSLDFR